MVLVVVDWVVRLCGEDEVGWNELSTLVEKLIEGVLSIGCGLAKEDWPCGVLHHLAIACNCLAVGFHGELLKIGWESVQILVEPELSVYI